MKKMTIDEIPAFVADVAATGCDITAITDGYVFGDADLPRDRYEEVEPILKEITERYGDRDHLLKEISAYLISIGRVYPPPVRH